MGIQTGAWTATVAATVALRLLSARRVIIAVAQRSATLMRFPIPSLIGAPFLALLLLPSAPGKPTTSDSNLYGRTALGYRLATKGRGPTLQVRATIPGIDPAPTVGAQAANGAAAAPNAVGQTAPAASAPPSAAEVRNEAAGALAAKILEDVSAGNALALSVKNISTLGDDEVAQVRHALRAQMRSRGIRLTASKQANADVQVTLSENTEGYLWIAEIRDHPSSNAPVADAKNTVVMLPVARANRSERHPDTEPLSVRKTWVYDQPDRMLDVALLDNPAAVPTASPAPRAATARILVLGLESITLYEEVEVPEAGSKSEKQWRVMQSAPVSRTRPWPSDARGRIIVRSASLFDAYLPGTRCTGGLDPVLSLECHESDDPWPLVAGTKDDNNPGASVWPAASFTADRNYFDGRVRLDDGRELTLPPFLAAVLVPRNAAVHAGMPVTPARAPAGSTAEAKVDSADPPGWVVSGLDGRVLLLNSNAQAVANTGGWGSQIVGVQSGCGDGWQVLTTQAGDLNETDAVQAFEIVERKPVPVSGPVEFPGPITELWPRANGSEAIAIARNLQTGAYEAFRLSVTCGQ